MSSISGKSTRPNSLADKIAGFDDPSMGDERERDIILRAYTFSSVVCAYTLFALGIVFAIIGAGMWSGLIILTPGVAGVAVSAYCKRENIDYSMAVARVSPKRMLVSSVVGGIVVIVWVAVIVFHVTTGHPLIEIGLGSVPNTITGSSPFIIGAAVGFVGATAARWISRSRKIKRARAEASAIAEIKDED